MKFITMKYLNRVCMFVLAMFLMGAKPMVSLEELFWIIVNQMVAFGISLECAICVAKTMLHMGGCG